MGGLFTKLFRAFYSKQLEVVLVGLENSGKTTVLNVLSQGAALETVRTEKTIRLLRKYTHHKHKTSGTDHRSKRKVREKRRCHNEVLGYRWTTDVSV